jgi:FtsZ-binding cell division protein ZapB
METQITKQLKKAIKEVTGIDINENSRKREIIEARAIYYKLIRLIDKKKSLKSIGQTVGKDHATVLHSLNNYDMFEKFNPSLRLYTREVLARLDYTSDTNYDDKIKDKKIEELNVDIIKLQLEIENLQEKIKDKTTNKYNIINNIESLLIETQGTEQHETLIERLQAFYKMNSHNKY